MNIEEKKQMRRELVAFIGFFYLIPIMMLYFGLLPFWSRHIILVIMSLILTAYAIGKPIAAHQLGFRTDNLKASLWWNVVAIAGGILAIMLGWKLGFLVPKYGGYSIWFYLFYVLISAPIQEFVFRSLMFFELNLLTRWSGWLKVAISAFVFSMAHVVYRDPTVLLVTFLIGLFWGYIYYKKPNFWGVALSHAVLGAITVFFGIV